MIQEQIDLLEAHETKLVAAGYPPSLAKATVELFDCAYQLRTAEPVRVRLFIHSRDGRSVRGYRLVRRRPDGS